MHEFFRHHKQIVCVAIFLTSSGFLFAQNIPDSCAVRDWFQLRDSVAHDNGSLLCKGVMDAAFEHRHTAERELTEFIRKEPNSKEVGNARDTLISLSFRHGQYQKTLLQVDQGLRERPNAEDLIGLRSMVAVLAQSPGLRVAHSARVTVQGENILDTGANISVISESEAKRLGLVIRDTSSKIGDIGGSAGAMRLTEAPDLWIGDFHLKNVAFAVLPDADEPFVGEPVDHQGVLGIPIFLALESLRFEKNGQIVVRPTHAGASRPSASLAFNGHNPLMQLLFQRKPLTFTLDTGADGTYLYKPFADKFPVLMQEGKQHQKQVTGVFGSSSQDSIDMGSLRLSVAQSEVELKPATVILNATTDTSKWTDGNFGFDLLQKMLPVTIDFHAMQMSFGN